LAHVFAQRLAPEYGKGGLTTSLMVSVEVARKTELFLEVLSDRTFNGQTYLIPLSSYLKDDNPGASKERLWQPRTYRTDDPQFTDLVQDIRRAAERGRASYFGGKIAVWTVEIDPPHKVEETVFALEESASYFERAEQRELVAVLTLALLACAAGGAEDGTVAWGETHNGLLLSLIQATCAQGIKESIPVLEDLMSRQNSPYRSSMIHALSVLKGTAYEDRLLELLRSTKPEERQAAAHGLHNAGARRGINPLVAALKDESAGVRKAAMFSIRQLAPKVTDEQAKAAAPILIDLMENDHQVGHNGIHNTLVRLAGIARWGDRPPNGPFGEDLKAARLRCARAWRQWWGISDEPAAGP